MEIYSVHIDMKTGKAIVAIANEYRVTHVAVVNPSQVTLIFGGSPYSCKTAEISGECEWLDYWKSSIGLSEKIDGYSRYRLASWDEKNHPYIYANGQRVGA